MYSGATDTRASAFGAVAGDDVRAVTSTAQAARRMSRPAEVGIVAALCLVALCLFYSEIIFQNRTFLPFGYPAEVMGPAPPWQYAGTLRPNPYRLDAGGSAWQLEPWARMVATSWKSRALPMWNPYQFGTPLAADAQPGPFDILRLPAMLTTRALGWDVYYLLQAALGLALTYAFARSAGFRPEASFVAGVAYTFCGFVFIRGNLHYAEIYHLLPALLWGTELIVQGRLRLGVLIVAAAVVLCVFAGFPEVLLLGSLYAVSYGVFRCAWGAVARRSWRFAAHRYTYLALAWIAGIAVGAPQLVPLLEYIPLSHNIHPPERNLGLVTWPLRALSYLGVPYIAGLPTQPLVAGDPFTVDDYSGAAVLTLAIVGAMSLRRLDRPRPVAVFALISALIWGAKLYGVPGVQELGRLPVLVQTIIHIFGLPLLSLSLALLAAAGVHAIATVGVSRRVVVGAGLAIAVYLAAVAAINWSTLREAGVRHAQETLGLAALAAVAALACAAIFNRSHARAFAATAACMVVVAELVALAPRNVYSDRHDTLAQPPFVSWLQRQQQLPGQPFRVFSNDGILYPDYAGAFGIQDLRTVDALYPRRVWDFVQTFLSPSISDRYVGGFGHPELPTDLFASKWLNFSNVRYILRPAGLGPADATLAQTIIAANYPPTDAQHLAQLTLDGQRREVLVQRTPGDVTYRMRPDAARPTLTFFVGLDPNADPSSAVEFTLLVGANGQRHAAFQQSLAAGSDQGRHWVPGNVDLSPYVGQDIELVLRTRSLGGSDTSAAGWGDLRASPAPPASQFKQVYNGEVSIWENTQAAARAFLVSDVQRAESSGDAIARMQAPGFDPLTSAVVEGDVNVPPASSSVGNAMITSYSPQQVQIAVEAQQPALLVLTDTYYPGWSATVDGGAAPILPTDSAFRGVVVPAGSHDVEFHFAPASFRLGLVVALGALVVLVLAVWRLPTFGLTRTPRSNG